MINLLFKKRIYTFLLCCGTLLFIGAAFFILKDQKQAAIPKTQPVPKVSSQDETKEPFTIIAFGDSLTAGYGVTLEESYPVLLEKTLRTQNKNIKIINMGVSGETTTGSLDRTSFIISQKPALVLLEIGANDMLRASSPRIARENIKTILKRFQDGKIDVVLLGMKSTASNGEDYRQQFDDIYQSLAKEYSLPLVPFFLEGVALNPSLNTSDGIHPNKLGYEKIINDNILPILLPVLARKGI